MKPPPWIRPPFFLMAILATSAAAWAGEPAPPGPLRCGSRTDWPTLHGDLARSGFYPAFPSGRLKLVWRKELYRELLGPRCEVIVADGLAFMGTYAGNLYAWDAFTGDLRWTFRAGGPIGHSPMVAGGRVYYQTGSQVRCLEGERP